MKFSRIFCFFGILLVSIFLKDVAGSKCIGVLLKPWFLMRM